MSTRDLAWAAVALALVGCASATVTSAPVTETPNLGHTATPAQIAGWDISIQPDGGGLPSGNGTPAKGAVVYEQKCQACHGVSGAGQADDRRGGGQRAAGCGVAVGRCVLTTHWSRSNVPLARARAAAGPRGEREEGGGQSWGVTVGD